MNIKLTIIILLVIISGITNSSCKKTDSEEPLPPYTEIGANTFSFRVQGKEYDVHVSWSFPRISVFYNYIDTVFHKNYLFEIEGNRVFSDDNKHIIINVQSLTQIGDYKLSIYNGGGNGDFATYADDGPAQSIFGTDSIHTGNLTITKLDTINHIIAGKFEFKPIQSCVYRICNSVITVDGQFDIKYKPNNNVDYY